MQAATSFGMDVGIGVRRACWFGRFGWARQLEDQASGRAGEARTGAAAFGRPGSVARAVEAEV